MIAEQLLATGLLQFGAFANETGYRPYRLRLEMLSAYPALLRLFVGKAPIIDIHVDRLLSASDCVPYASVMSVKRGVSLVYSRGSSAAAVHDLIGAYDIGHPTCLIVNTTGDDVTTLLMKAEQGGLRVEQILALVDIGERLATVQPVTSIIQLTEVVEILSTAGLIPMAQANAVLSYVASRRRD